MGEKECQKLYKTWCIFVSILFLEAPYEYCYIWNAYWTCVIQVSIFVPQTYVCCFVATFHMCNFGWWKDREDWTDCALQWILLPMENQCEHKKIFRSFQKSMISIMRQIIYNIFYVEWNQPFNKKVSGWDYVIFSMGEGKELH